MALENYFRHFEDVLTGQDERDPWPKKEDLKPEIIYIDQKSCLDVQSFLDEHRYCLLEGAERRGKTTLVRYIGLQYVKDWHVYRIDVSRVSDTRDLDDFVHLLKGGFFDRPGTLIIVEDCHIKPEVTQKLLKTVEECQEASFLFTMRTVKQMRRIPVEDPFEDSKIRAQGWVVRLDETEEIIYNNVKGIVDKFVETHSSDLKHKSTKATPTSDDYSYLVEQTGSNKRILKYYLEAWASSKDPDLPLRQVNRELVLKQFHKERLEGLNEVQIEVLLTMSALGQFEVPIFIRPLFPSAVSKLDFDRAGDELSALKGLAFKLPQGAWLLADTESKLTLECMRYLKRIGDSFVPQVLMMYVKEASNYFEVFHLLHRAQERNLLILLAKDTEVSTSLVNRLRNTETTLGDILYVLRAIGWADKAEGLDLWREYKKALGEQFLREVQRKLAEAQDIRLTQILLRFLKTIDREGEALPLANAIPTELLTSQARLEVTGFTYLETTMTLLNNLAPEKAKQMLTGLDKSDYARLGEKARQTNLQRVMWFLHWLTSDEKLKGFADHFLNGIGQDVLTKMASVSAISTFRRVRGMLNKLNTDTAREIGRNLRPAFPEEEWIERWSNETVGRQSRRLWGWARSLKPELRNRGKKLAKRLANADVALHFGEAEVVAPVKQLGWLLFSAYFLDEEAAKGLAVKAVKFFDAGAMRYSLQHLVFLLKESRWCNPDAAHQLVEKILSTDPAYLLSKGELDWYCRLVWEAVLSNELKTKEQVTDVKATLWEDLAVNASHSDAFHLLLVLWQVNEDIGRGVTHAVGQRLLASPNLRDDPQALPLLGFLSFCGLDPQVTFSFSIEENVDKLCIYPTNRRLACSLFYLQDSEPEIIPGFIKAVLTLSGVKPETALLLAKHPLPWTASTLADILISAKGEIQREGEDVYDRMILLFRTIRIRRRIIYLGTLFNEMCAPQFAQQRELTLEAEGGVEREEEKTRSWATIRLANAIDKGIFTVQKTEHPITHKASRLLSLNMGHPQVTFALDMTGNLLLALHDAQRGEGWADCITWDAAFKNSWKGEPLPPQQLRYWQGILLRMNVVKVDYKETNKGDWTIVFGVNSDHPLVKSFIKV